MLAWNLFGCFWLPIWALLWSLSLQDDQTFAFVNPPPVQSTIQDPTYDVGAPIDIRWLGSNKFVSVRLVHNLPHGNTDEFVYVFENVTNLGGHFTWVIDLGTSMNLTISNSFFFNIFVEGEHYPRAVSHNITLANPSISTTASSITSTATQTTLSTSTTAPSTTTTSPPASTTTATPSPTTSAASSNSGLSSGAKAGVGVGVAVGAVAILAAGFFFWRRSRAGKAAAGAAGGAGSGNAPPTNYHPVNQEAYSGFYKPPPPGAPSELSEGTTRLPPSEMAGSVPTAHEMADTSRG